MTTFTSTRRTISSDPVRNVHRVQLLLDGWRMSCLVCECGESWSGKHAPALRIAYERHILDC